MGLPEMRSVEGYDFTLQGVYGVWNGRPATSGRGAESSTAATQREVGSDGFLYSKAVATRSTASRGSRTPDDSLDSGYIKAMDTIIRQRPDEFLDAKFPQETSKRLHRRFMLAICGELTGIRLEAEIQRYAPVLIGLRFMGTNAGSHLQDFADTPHQGRMDRAR